MARPTRLRPAIAVPPLVAFAVVSTLVLVYSRRSGSVLVQSAAVLIALGLVFFSTHPLGHFAVAALLHVHTDYFFLGRSDFRKLPSKPLRAIGARIPTLGTKLRGQELSSLLPKKRGYIFGAGVMASNALVAVELLVVLGAGFMLLPSLLGLAFLVATLGTELAFSTKSGDLAKMRAEFDKD